MKTGFEFNARKVWEFVETKPFELSQKNISIHMPAKYIFENYIEHNPIILQKYTDLEWSGKEEPHTNETLAQARLADGSRFDNAESVKEEEKLPTYYDIKYAQSSKIFEAAEVMGTSPEQLQEAEKAYAILLEKLNNKEEVDEGFLGALAGGAVGALAGPAIGRAICRALGIEENGNLGKLLTSRLVTTAIGISLGKG
jgi:hypothetical protein